MVKIELNPLTEAKLAEQAEAKGISLSRYLEELIEDVASAGPVEPAARREDAFVEWADSLDVPAGVHEEAFHRANWYR